MLGQRGEILRFVAGGGEAIVVDAVVNDRDVAGGRNQGSEPVGGVGAHAYDGRRALRRGANHAPEVHDLRSFMPLGMIEEGEIVHGDHARHRRPQRHRVVRSVPDVGLHPCGQGRAASLLPREAGGPARRCRCVQRRGGCEIAPALACRRSGSADAGRSRRVPTGPMPAPPCTSRRRPGAREPRRHRGVRALGGVYESPRCARIATARS